MKEAFGDPYAPAHGYTKEFGRCVRAQERKLRWLSDAEFINWDKSLLACPQPGPFAEDKDFAVLNAAIVNERRRRRDKHNGLFGWRRVLTPADREIWLEYYKKAIEMDSKRPRKGSAIGPQMPEQAGH